MVACDDGTVARGRRDRGTPTTRSGPTVDALRRLVGVRVAGTGREGAHVASMAIRVLGGRPSRDCSAPAVPAVYLYPSRGTTQQCPRERGGATPCGIHSSRRVRATGAWWRSFTAKRRACTRRGASRSVLASVRSRPSARASPLAQAPTPTPDGTGGRRLVLAPCFTTGAPSVLGLAAVAPQVTTSFTVGSPLSIVGSREVPARSRAPPGASIGLGACIITGVGCPPVGTTTPV